jgi:hypothetical protein
VTVPTIWPTSLLRVGVVVVLAVVASACDSGSAVRRERPQTSGSVPSASEVSPRWAQTMSGPSNEDEFDGVGASQDGSVYVTGKFEGTVTLGGVSLESAGAADIPFARFDAQEQPVWAKRFGGAGEDNLFDVNANADGAIATGAFSGTVAFGSTTLTSSGPWDCVIVALAPDGQTRWARAFGGPGRDGCNEVTIDRSGAVTTSIDTQGGWTPVDGPPLPRVRQSDTVLMRLTSDGSPTWMRPVSGADHQRGKSLAVAPDGSVSFGGDTIGPLTIAGRTVEAPASGGLRDAWLSRWTPDGTLQWVDAWGGPGDDLAKGVVDDGDNVSYVGPFTGTLTVGGTALDAGEGADTLVAQRSATGTVRWATSVSASAALDGSEAVAASDGGILFGSQSVPGIQFGSTQGPAIPLDDADGGTAWLAHYRPNGTPGFARTVAGTANGRVGEIARAGSRVYVDVALRGSANTINGTPIAVVRKDASVWALDLAG